MQHRRILKHFKANVFGEACAPIVKDTGSRVQCAVNRILPPTPVGEK